MATCTITSPANGATVTAPTFPCTVEWNAGVSEGDPVVYTVTCTGAAPYENAPSSGTHVFTVSAVGRRMTVTADLLGGVTIMADNSITVNVNPPG